MKGYIGNILQEIDIEIDEIDLYGYDIIETSLSMVHKLQTVLDDLRTKIQTYIFPTKEDEILFCPRGQITRVRGGQLRAPFPNGYTVIV